MRNIFLLGDSIRCGAPTSPGYGVYVKQMLEGKANVYAPKDNCRFGAYTLRHLHNWIDDKIDCESIDTVHWNNGLWEVAHIDGQEEPLFPIELYTYYLERTYKSLRKNFPNAKIIFALSTPVKEYPKNRNLIRYNDEIIAYNNAAKALMEKLGVEINDLYTVAYNMGEEKHSDFVHFNEEGSRILAEAIVKKIGF